MGLRLTHGHVPPFRKAERIVPKAPITLPYDMRHEMTWYDFTNKSNPLGAPKEIVRSMQDSLVSRELSYSPDPQGHQLRHMLSVKLNIPEKYILVGNSPTQLMRLAAEAFPPSKVAIPVPCPASYFNSMKLAGHSVVSLQMQSTFATPQAYAANETIGDFNAAVIGNPSIPASRFSTRKTVMHYADVCDWVMVDESYFDLSYSGESMISLINKYKNVMVLRSISATYGMPGVPIAYMVASEEIISHIKEFFDGSSNTMFSEVISDFLRNDHIYMEHTHDLMDSEIPWLHSMLSKVPQMETFAPDGNFILCKYDPDPSLYLGAKSCNDLLHKLQLKGFLLQNLQGWPGLPGKGYFSVAVRTREENEALIQAMRSTVVVEMHL